MTSLKEVRIDKWLWATRIYKTRSQATEACKKGKVIINKIPVKPSRIVKIGEEIQVKKLPVIYTYKVKGLLEKRISAQLVHDYMKDLTSNIELQKLKLKNDNFFVREKGSGRPTKKERRIIENLKNNNDLF